MGNLYAESALKAGNPQNTGTKALGLTDEKYKLLICILLTAKAVGGYDAEANDISSFSYGQKRSLVVK